MDDDRVAEPSCSSLNEFGGTRPANGSSGDGSLVLKSMSTPVSPPRKRRREDDEARETKISKTAKDDRQSLGPVSVPSSCLPPLRPILALRSPFQLTAIHDLPPSANVDALTINDVFGDPRVTECWEFNYLHDLEFLMGAFHADARQRGVDVHIVHGFWKRDDPRRIKLEAAARQHASGNSQEANSSSVTLHTAYMPEIFGTHHTKMAVLFHHDDTVQVVIHTANLIPHDWHNMTQAVWRSPVLPLMKDGKDESVGSDAAENDPDCIGRQFKHDLLSYLQSYNEKRSVCQALVDKLERYDFSAVRGVLIGSVPGRHHVPFPDEEVNRVGDDRLEPTHWGWLALQRALQNVPLHPKPKDPSLARNAQAEIVIQVSSIATLGGTDAWLQRTLFAALSGGKLIGTSEEAEAAAKRRASNFGPLQPQRPRAPRPQFRIMFPTANEIRQSLDGYDSGSSIHTRIQSPQQQKQLSYILPLLCHWANDAKGGAALPPVGSGCVGDAERQRAAPHVKTYVRYSSSENTCHIDWALLTSANLSKQAWGEARSAGGEMRIASYELGVLVWPELLTGVKGSTMEPVFGRDDLEYSETASSAKAVPLRIPYSLPVQRYGPGEIPWVGSLPHGEPDWRGVSVAGEG
ncbi:hypothetical protein SEPCBS57363_005576 [Sporothrix epigloea]|uniref:Tyrosyl-DNA phosphodiesterase n=1 Tax=Sporothrix epigloea TaxID=1892477 RepID=A0ABP0E0J8_9PEZI